MNDFYFSHILKITPCFIMSLEGLQQFCIPVRVYFYNPKKFVPTLQTRVYVKIDLC